MFSCSFVNKIFTLALFSQSVIKIVSCDLSFVQSLFPVFQILNELCGMRVFFSCEN